MKLAGFLSPNQSSLAVIGIGYCIGMQLSKIAPYVERISTQYDISLTFVGWLASLLGLFIAFSAGAAGRFVSRRGALSALKIGLVTMGAGALLLGALPGPWPMLFARAIEAVGYVLAVVAAPVYLSLTASPSNRGTFLAMWGGFVSVGYMIATSLAMIVPDNWSVSASLLVYAVPLILGVIVTLFLDDGDGAVKTPPPPKRQFTWLSLGAISIGLAFTFYVYINLAFFTFLPALASKQPGQILHPALIALFVPVGNFAAAYLLSAGASSRAPLVAAAGFVITGIAMLVFPMPGPVGQVATLFYSFGCGLSASSIFAVAPLMGTEREGAPVIIGIIAQAGGVGTLLSAPIAGTLIEHFGWAVLPLSFVILAFVSAGLMGLVMRQIKNT